MCLPAHCSGPAKRISRPCAGVTTAILSSVGSRLCCIGSIISLDSCPSQSIWLCSTFLLFFAGVRDDSRFLVQPLQWLQHLLLGQGQSLQQGHLQKMPQQKQTPRSELLLQQPLQGPLLEQQCCPQQGLFQLVKQGLFQLVRQGLSQLRT